VIPTLRMRDIWHLYRFQHEGLFLDGERMLIEGYSPLKVMLRSYVDNGVRTYITQDAAGKWHVLQLVRRDDRPEWDITFVAPAHSEQAKWRPLIEQVARDAVHKGAYRLYALLPPEARFLSALQESGFRPYTQERIYRLHRDAHPHPLAFPQHIRPRTPADMWNLSRLWRQTTPALVAAMESLPGSNSLDLPYQWEERPGRRVYLWEEGSDLLGAIVLHQGRKATGMRIILAPNAEEDVGYDLLNWSIHVASSRKEKPLYCTLRHYQVNEGALLADTGFEPYAEQSCLIRHLALPVGADESVTSGLLSLLEIRGEAVYTLPLGTSESQPLMEVWGGAHQEE